MLVIGLVLQQERPEERVSLSSYSFPFSVFLSWRNRIVDWDSHSVLFSALLFCLSTHSSLFSTP